MMVGVGTGRGGRGDDAGLVPGRRLTEAYGWITTTIAVANATGQAAGGTPDPAIQPPHRLPRRNAVRTIPGLPVWISRQHLVTATPANP
jgi:hypothetical protein